MTGIKHAVSATLCITIQQRQRHEHTAPAGPGGVLRGGGGEARSGRPGLRPRGRTRLGRWHGGGHHERGAGSHTVPPPGARGQTGAVPRTGTGGGTGGPTLPSERAQAVPRAGGQAVPRAGGETGAVPRTRGCQGAISSPSALRGSSPSPSSGPSPRALRGPSPCALRGSSSSSSLSSLPSLSPGPLPGPPLDAALLLVHASLVDLARPFLPPVCM